MINEREKITGRNKRSGGMSRSDPRAESPLSCSCHRGHLSSPPPHSHNKGDIQYLSILGLALCTGTPSALRVLVRGGKRLFIVTN